MWPWLRVNVLVSRHLLNVHWLVDLLGGVEWSSVLHCLRREWVGLMSEGVGGAVVNHV